MTLNGSKKAPIKDEEVIFRRDFLSGENSLEHLSPGRISILEPIADSQLGDVNRQKPGTAERYNRTMFLQKSNNHF